MLEVKEQVVRHTQNKINRKMLMRMITFCHNNKIYRPTKMPPLVLRFGRMYYENNFEILFGLKLSKENRIEMESKCGHQKKDLDQLLLEIDKLREINYKKAQENKSKYSRAMKKSKRSEDFKEGQLAFFYNDRNSKYDYGFKIVKIGPGKQIKLQNLFDDSIVDTNIAHILPAQPTDLKHFYTETEKLSYL